MTTGAASSGLGDRPSTSTHVEPATKPADQITVRHFRQILIWPLLLSAPREGEWNLDRCANELCGESGSGWQRADSQSDLAPTYEEIVYFYPFSRDFLFGSQAMKCLRRYDVDGVEVELAPSDVPEELRQLKLEVPRVELYLCKPAIAILAVEVASPADVTMTLQQALALQSRIRQVYPPYFTDDNASGNCPTSVTWCKKQQVTGQEPTWKKIEESSSNFEDGRETFDKDIRRNLEPPVARHWQWLLNPLCFAQQPNATEFACRQIIDDRIPGMTYLGVDNPRFISEGDFDRLAFCEMAEDTPFPYASAFLEASRDRYTYDRYWKREADEDGRWKKFTTRYLCSGFQFVAVGDDNSWFFRELIRTHFRRHYFRIGLLVHYQRAALLKIADEIADATAKLAGKPPSDELSLPQFREQVTMLEAHFLKFQSRAWYVEATSQLQGQELFEWWSRLLDTRNLFDDVAAKMDHVYNAVSEREARELTRSGATSARAQVVLAVFATLVVPIALWLSLCTIDFNNVGTWKHVVGGIGVVLATTYLWWKLGKSKCLPWSCENDGGEDRALRAS